MLQSRDFIKSNPLTANPARFSLWISIILAIALLPANAFGWVCGDANNDGAVSIGDGVFLMNLVFHNGPYPEVPDAADCNNDGNVNIGDAVVLVDYIFHKGSSPICFADGELVDYTGCKSFAKAAPPPDSECVEYYYDGNGALSLKHVNTGFNCCPEEMIVFIYIEDNSITIDETEIDGICDCLCLFDMDYEIRALTPGEYRIVFVSPLLEQEDEPLEITLDLSGPISGSYCVYRSHYPWGFE